MEEIFQLHYPVFQKQKLKLNKMDSTRLEILVEGVWRKLKLREFQSVSYNKLVNKIGNPTSREISHTNTFSLPYIEQNIKALEINRFNHNRLAIALNRRYECKYYIEEKILQEGFLIINNFLQDEIRVNFIDAALNIIEKWSNKSFRELILDDTLAIPADYKAAILEMQTYFLDKDLVAPFLSPVGARGYNLSLFPNNLNCIGEKFQQNIDGTREDDAFNSFQSRPIFNSKAVFDLACEAYGYTPIFDASVDWDSVASNYMVNSGLGESSKRDDSYVVQGIYIQPRRLENTRIVDAFDNGGTWTSITIVAGDPSQSTIGSKALIPNNIPGWSSPIGSWSPGYKDLKCVFVPNLSEFTQGKIKYTIQVAPSSIVVSPYKIYSCWENATPLGPVLFRELVVQSIITSPNGDNLAEFVVNKSELIIAPAGASSLIGVFGSLKEENPTTFTGTITIDETVLESFSSQDNISYDELGQYDSQSIDLTYAAPTKSIIELLKGLMNKDGILMEIDEEAKTVNFFNYNIYKNKVDAKDFEDWSDYLLKWNPFTYNTDYGNDYAKFNELGLMEPYLGNTNKVQIGNQGYDSKNKEFTTNYNATFKDVESVNNINNTTTPYIEFENKGLGLVTLTGFLGSLNQINTSKVSQGVINNLPELSNINYSILPSGIESWYNIVDVAVRSSPTLLIPMPVIRDLKLSKPIYIGEMNGYWLVEEISEYKNSSEPVTAKLIRVLNPGEFDAEFNGDFDNSFKT
jgi:hypothetical protein